jgi:NlpC/P60 family putative phage cell wall peptidase
MISRAQIIDEARRWVGTRYQHQAALRGIGCDCIGLVGGVALACGIPGAQQWADDPTLHTYAPEPDPKILGEACTRFLDPIDRRDALPGDILVMRFLREPQHFGLISAPNMMIHALSAAGVVAEHRIDAVWWKRVISAWKFRGIE